MTMKNFDEFKTATAVKNEVRKIGFNLLYKAACMEYGEENVSITGSNEVAVCIGYRTLSDGTEGEVCFTSAPVAKNFDRRVTPKGKIFEPFERLTEADIFAEDQATKQAEKESKAKAKEAKIAKAKSE